MELVLTNAGVQIQDYEDWAKAKDDIVFFAERYLDIKLHDYQKELIKSDRARRVVSRQTGSSMMACIKVLHTAIFNDSRNIAYVSPNLIQAYTKSEYIYELIAKFNSNLGSVPPLKLLTANKKHIQFENRSAIHFYSFSGSSSMRGRTFSDLYLEDVNFGKESDFDEFLQSVLPSCASGESVKSWAWSAKKRAVNDFETGDIDNIHKIGWSELEYVPFWMGSN